MSESTAEATATEPTAETTEAPQPKPAETVDFWKQKAREQEKRAKDNADAAKRLAEIEDAQKTETQKAADKLAAAERDVADARREALKFKVAAKFQISDEHADLYLNGSDEETLTKQAEGLAAIQQRRGGNAVPREGNNPTSTGEQDEAAFARSLLSPRE